MPIPEPDVSSFPLEVSIPKCDHSIYSRQYDLIRYACPMAVKVTNWERLGRKIKTLRQRKGLSQEELAAPTYTAAYISHLEYGRRHASREALEHIASKLGVTLEQLVSGRDPDEDLRLEIEIQRSLAEVHAGRAAEVVSVLEEVRDRAVQTGYTKASVQAEAGLGEALYKLGRIDEALGAFERAAGHAGDDVPERLTTALAGQARCLFHKGQPAEAMHLLESHLRDLDRSDIPDPGCLVEAYAALIPIYFEQGLVSRAKEVASKGLELAAEVPDPEQRACLYVNRAQLMLSHGQRRDALTSLAMAEDLYRHLGWYSEATKVTLARSSTLIDGGDLAGGEDLLRVALADEAATRSDRVRALTQLARVRRLRGAVEEGHGLAREALELAGDSFVNSAAEAAREAGLCAFALGRGDEAVALWDRALDGFLASDDHEEVARTAELIGDHLLEAGDAAAAAAAYRRGLGGVSRLR